MASFTRKAIQEAFLKLLDARPLNQITVKDIVVSWQLPCIKRIVDAESEKLCWKQY